MGIVAEDWSDLPDLDPSRGRGGRDLTWREAVCSYQGARTILLALDREDRYTVPHYVTTAARGFKEELADQVASRDRGTTAFLAGMADIADAVATVIGPHVRIDAVRWAPRTVEDGSAGPYERAVEVHASMARRWLSAVTISTVLVLVVLGWLSLGDIAADAERIGAGRLAVKHAPAVLLVTVLAFAISFCSRSYWVHRRAQRAYQERAAEINTYVSMGASIPEGIEGRAEILTELAKVVCVRRAEDTTLPG